MGQQVHFDEPSFVSRRSYSSARDNSALVSFLINRGIARDKLQAQQQLTLLAMVLPAIIVLVLFFGFRGGSSIKTNLSAQEKQFVEQAGNQSEITPQ